jgi:hypothetical protein
MEGCWAGREVDGDVGDHSDDCKERGDDELSL